MLTLEQLPADVQVEGAVLLAPALSPQYPLDTALGHTRRGIWNFTSWGDAVFLIFGTLVMGTIDGRHSISAGACGFRAAPPPTAGTPGTLDAETLQTPRLYEVPWRRAMLADRHFAGHFGCVHARFVREWIAPILAGRNG